MTVDLVRLRCKSCHKRVSIKPIYSRDNKEILFKCPKCLASGIFRNRDFIPMLHVHKIRIAPRIPFFGIVPSQSFLGGARIN